MKNIKFVDLKDEELVRLYVDSQNNIYFEEIYDRYVNKVYRKCFSFVYDQGKAEDFTHDVFLKLIVKIGTFKENAKFSTWLYSITYNYCMDMLRLEKKKAETPIDDNLEVEVEEFDHEFASMQTAGLKKSLDSVSTEEKAILLMKYQDGFSIREISETFSISESAVKMRLMRTKEKVKDLYLKNTAVFVLFVAKLIYIIYKN